MDADSDPRAIAPGNYLEAFNILNGAKSTNGSAVNPKGNSAFSYSMPSGTNTCIGGTEDKQCMSYVMFIDNSANGHRILRWFQEDGHVEEIVIGANLLFEPLRRVQAHVVDGRLLYWTDGFSDKEGMTGQEPRKINMAKASLYEKLLVAEFYAGFAGQGQFAELSTYTVSVKNISGVTTIESDIFVIPDNTLENDPAAGLAWLKEQIEASDLNDHVTLELCDCKLVATMSASDTKLTLATSASDVILVPANYYTAPLSDIQTYHMSLVKQAPSCAPEPTYIGVDDIAYNNVRDGCFQFRARYIYDDGEASHWSAISPTALNNAQDGGPQQSLNAIKVDFTDARLNSVSWLSIIRWVEIAFRDGNDDTFKLIKRIPICEIGIGEQYIIFKNDELYSTVASDDFSVGSPDTQVLTNWHRVPERVGTLSPIDAQDGGLRMSLSCLEEGQVCPLCVEGSAEAVNYDDENLVDIIGTVQINNDAFASDTDINFQNYALNGIVVYLAGTPYYAISDNPADGSGTGAFRIKNVPRGQYTLRVASYQCRYDDTLSPRYNLLNGLDWQRTSSPVVDVAGGTVAHGTQHERIIDLYGFVGAEFDLDAEVGYGVVAVQNTHQALSTDEPTQRIKVIEIYFLDNQGAFDTSTVRYGATSVEGREIDFYFGDAGGYEGSPAVSVRTDHNGYAWALVKREIGPSSGIRPVHSDWGGDDTNGVQDYRIFAGYNDGWGAINSDTAIDLNDGVTYTAYLANLMKLFPSDDAAAHIGFAYQPDPAWTPLNRIAMTGSCVDANGVGVADVLVWMVTNGRFTRTNQFGAFSLVTYGWGGFSPPARTADQELHVTYLGDAAGTYPPDPLLEAGAFIMENHPDGYNAGTFEFGFIGGIPFEQRFVKAGGIYKVAVLYEDGPGRSPCGAQPFATVSVPFHTADDNGYVPKTIQWTIDSIPPSWAVRFRILITKDSFYQTYRHLPVSKVIYASIPQNSTDIQNVGYSAGTATHILLGIRTQVPNDPNAVPTLLMFRDNVQNGYASKFGDRVRYLLDETQETVFTNGVLEVSVEGEYVDGIDYYVVIPYTEIAREIVPGWLFEFFTPKGFEEEIFWETGGCYDILTGPNRHSGDIQDQDLLVDPVLPAIGNINFGDTYWRLTQFELASGDGVVLSAEHETRSDYQQGRCADIGRPFVHEPDAGLKYRFNWIRVSGQYIPTSNTNNMSAYGALDYKALNRVFGPIKWTGLVRNSLLCICQSKVQPVYVGKARVMDLTGSNFIGRNSEVLSVADDTVADAGTLNPESVASLDGQVFWWDLMRAEVWRFGGDGITKVSAGKIKYFIARHDERVLVARDEDIVVGGVDRRNGLYFITFGAATYPGPENTDVPVTQDTLSFDPAKFSQIGKGWSSHWSFNAENYGAVSDEFLTFSGGRLYTNYDNVLWNRYFNSNSVSRVKFVVNQDPQAMKDWLCLRLQANKKWYGKDIQVPATASWPSGMASKIPAARMLLAEGTFWADFLGDKNDPHTAFTSLSPTALKEATAMLRGRPLKGEVLIVEIETESGTVEHILFRADVEYADSQNTK